MWQNTITNVLIFAIVGWLVKVMATPTKKSKTFTADRFSAEYPMVMKALMWGGFAFFSMFMILNYGNIYYHWGIGVGWGIGTSIGFTAMWLLALSCIMGVVIWRIDVDGDEVVYRDYFGVRHKYEAKDFDKIRIKKNGTLQAFVKGKHIFSIDSNEPMGHAYMMLWARERGIPREDLRK